MRPSVAPPALRVGQERYGSVTTQLRERYD